MEQSVRVKRERTVRIMFAVVLCAFFLSIFFFPYHNAACETSDVEIKELKEQLKQAQAHIELLTKRLEAVEQKVAANSEAKTSAKDVSASVESAEPAKKPDMRAYDLETATILSSQTSDEVRATGGEVPIVSQMVASYIAKFSEGAPKSHIKEIEQKEAYTTDKVRKLAEKFKYFPEGFEFHGYLRSGFGINSEGGQQVAFQAPGAPCKYRLGNETETYGELLFTQNFNPEEKGPFFNANVRLAFKTLEQNGSDPTNDEFSVKEAYAEMGNFDWAPGAKFWAGERFYRREDIYIIDYYFLDMSGYGGGVQDINLWDWAKLSAAWIGGANDDFNLNKIGSVAKNSFDIRISEFNLPIGKGEIWLDPSFVKGGDYLDSAGRSQKYNSAGGFAAGFIHTIQKPIGIDGYNKFSVQYGVGSSSDFSANIQVPDTKIQGRKTLQFTNAGVIRPWNDFAMMYTFVYKGTDNGAENDSRIDWFSAGARPIYFINKHVALALEVGADHVNSRVDHYDDTLFKISFAPELRIDNTFLGRPVLRAYVTYSAWGNDFKGRVGGSTYSDDTSGLAAGVQMEAWW